MNDWREFLEEVHKENEKYIEWSKQRQQNVEESTDCEACEVK